MNDAITIGGYLLWRLALGADPNPEGGLASPQAPQKSETKQHSRRPIA
jgi:hypothetical protein